MDQGARRERLIAEIRCLPAERVPQLEEWVRALAESGDKSPHSTGAQNGNPGNASPPQSKDWPHAPLHRISEHGTYIVTAGTLRKQHYFRGPERLDLLESALLAVVKQAGWQLEAWAVFTNHYHFLAHSKAGAQDLRTLPTALHADTSRRVNRLDRAVGRHVWHNFWDTKLTFEKSYFARLSYVHHNPVKHGLVRVANQYR
jgi:putative transposase